MIRTRIIKAFSELRDLEIFDSAGELCGVADEVEFAGAPGEPLKASAILVGPGAFAGRLPWGLSHLVRWIGGDRVVRVPWAAIEHVTSRISLNRTADELGLARGEARLGRLLKHIPPG